MHHTNNLQTTADHREADPVASTYPAATDLIVTTANPEALDATVQQLGAAVVVEGSWNSETCRVNVFGDAGYIRFAIINQGYGHIVGQEPVAQGSTDAVR